MKVAVITVLSSVVILCGCANNRTYRPGPGGPNGAVTSPGSSTNLGLPAPTFGSPDNSSSYGPSPGGPALLGLPEAKRTKSGPDALPSLTPEAPHRQVRVGAI